MISDFPMGILDISTLNNPPEKHELKTANYFANIGYDVVFIRPSYLKNIHTPDIMMDGKAWEMKSPQGKTLNCITDNIRDAVKQSSYIIIDLRRMRLHDEVCVEKIKTVMKRYKAIRKIYIITHSGKLLTFNKTNIK